MTRDESSTVPTVEGKTSSSTSSTRIQSIFEARANGGTRGAQRFSPQHVGAQLPMGSQGRRVRARCQSLQAFGPRERARDSVRALGEFTDEETDAFFGHALEGRP
jgi:hypothetical protein